MEAAYYGSAHSGGNQGYSRHVAGHAESDIRLKRVDFHDRVDNLIKPVRGQPFDSELVYHLT